MKLDPKDLKALCAAIIARRAALGLPAIFRGANYRKARESAAKRLGWPRAPTLRDLRHTYATLALLGTGDAAGVMAALGHRDLRTTARYLSSTTARAAAVSAAVARAFAPEHPDRITGAGAAPEIGATPGFRLERATRFELATSSLEGQRPLDLWLRSLAAEVEEERQKARPDGERPEHLTGAPARRKSMR